MDEDEVRKGCPSKDKLPLRDKEHVTMFEPTRDRDHDHGYGCYVISKSRYVKPPRT